MAQAKKNNLEEISTSEKNKALYQLQTVVSEIDRIKILRGELPLEVQDLEDEIEGLKTRIEKIKDYIKKDEGEITGRKADITNSNALLVKYKEQQSNVRNNREYDFLSKEIEYQGLEIELSEKKIREAQVSITNKKEDLAASENKLSERSADLDQKKAELESIISETKADEEKLTNNALELESKIEPRLLKAFKRIRSNAKNGLAVVTVQRGACGGCFNQIPPQRELDVKMGKKIIVCEFCGRILVDEEFVKGVEGE